MYNLIGLVVCLFFADISEGVKGKALPLTIAAYYVLSIAIDVSMFGFVHAFASSGVVSIREDADTYILLYNILAFAVILACCVVSKVNRRSSKVALVYAAWLLIVIASNTVIHLINWDGAGVSDEIIGIFQLLCIFADISAAMLGGDNAIGRRVIRSVRPNSFHNRRGSDRAIMADI